MHPLVPQRVHKSLSAQKSVHLSYYSSIRNKHLLRETTKLLIKCKEYGASGNTLIVGLIFGFRECLSWK